MSLVEVKLLGPLEVVVDGRTIKLRRHKQRALLALLALRVGEVVSRDRLVDGLWGETPPKSAVGSLQNLVSEVRKLVGPDLLVTRAPGYALELNREAVDAHRLERAVQEGIGLQEALSLWRGPALADLASEPFAQAEIARLAELRATAREELFELELAEGRHAQVVADLEAFVAEHPLRERARGQLMLALDRSGRQADALEAYRQARQTLVEELGIDPSPKLQQLEQAILSHDSVAYDDGAPALRAPDRRTTVTVLFADLVDSTELAAQLDPELLRGVMTRYFDAARTIVERHVGAVEKFIGDAVMAVFGAPTVHEDDALRAVRAATELRKAMAALNADLSGEYGIALELRIGLNSGEVLAGDPGSGESFTTGKAVNIAMRLEQAALPGEILLGESTYQFVRHAVHVEPGAQIELGGTLGRVPAFRLLEVREAGRPLSGTSLVGRSDELAWLRAAFAGVCAERRSRVVTVLGEAGVGKTRLVSELISGLGNATTFVGRCISYGEGATFLPLAEIVRQVAPANPRQTIAALLPDDEHADLIAERVTQLTGRAEGVFSTGEVFWAVRRFFEALAFRRPLVVVLEDVHWAEPTLLDLVGYLDAWAANGPLLVLCLARPELLEQRQGWRSAERTLVLEPLDLAEAQMLVADLAGDELAAEAKAQIVEVAEGNPLFLEQLLALAEEAGIEALATVPPTVEALLAGRIGRLEPKERALLERAAVVGREFVRAAVVQLSPPEEPALIDRGLRTLAGRGFIEAAGDTFRFHHALIREVAYSGITKKERANLHELLANWLEQREDGAVEVIGYHLEQAYCYRAQLNPGDRGLSALAERASERLAQAGGDASGRGDDRAAANLLGRANELLPTDDRRRLELLPALGRALWETGEYAQARAAIHEAIEASQAVGDRRLELHARIALMELRIGTDPELKALELVRMAKRAMPVFSQFGDDRGLAKCWGLVSSAHWNACQFGPAAQAAERALRHAELAGDRLERAGLLGSLAVAAMLGPISVNDGLRRCERIREQAEGSRSVEASVCRARAVFIAMQGGFEEARSLLKRATKIREEQGQRVFAAVYSVQAGTIELLADDASAAERALRAGYVALAEIGETGVLSTVAALLAETLYVQGRLSEAEELTRTSERAASRDDLLSHVLFRMTRAKVLASCGDLEQAKRLAYEGTRLAETSDDLMMRADALMNLGEVFRHASRPDQAAEAVEEARQLYEQKGNVVSAAKAVVLLKELTTAQNRP